MARMLAPALLATVTTALALAFAALWRTERRRRGGREREERSASRLAMLAENAHDILLMFDDAGRLVEANARAVAVYGWSREELLKLHVREIRAPGAREELAEQLA